MNYNQYLEDYWPDEEPNTDTAEQYKQYQMNYYGQVSCIDRQIAELEARRDAILHGYCFTGHLSNKPYLDPYGLDDELLNEEENKDYGLTGNTERSL